jgi:Ca2+-binding RTX toxin-like protein
MGTIQWWVLTEGDDHERIVRPEGRITFITGDLDAAPNSNFNGGDDHIEVVDTHFDFLFGDALRAGATNGQLFRGGDDVLTVVRAGGTFTISGDLNYSNSGKIFGGDDLIDGRYAGRTGIFVGDVSYADSPLVGGDDTIVGSSGDDRIFGDARIATVTVKAGNDRLYGGDGNDTIFGDVARGDSGRNAKVVSGDDRLDGGGGEDLLRGQSGNDTLIGGWGNDTLDGGSGQNWATFSTISQAVTVDLQDGYAIGQGFDRLISIQSVTGSMLDDVVSGSAAANILKGRGGDDLLAGRDGNDILGGGSGNDTLIGGAGNDTLAGSAGADVFVLSPGQGADVVKDFELGVDRFDLGGAQFTGVAEHGHNTILTFETGSVTMLGITGLNLSEWNDLM